MAIQMEHSLLALLLALQDLEKPLNEDEKSFLADLAAQLYLQPEAWEDYSQDSLQKVLEVNSALNQAYQKAAGQLKAVNGEIPSELLPSEADVEQVLPASPEVITRGMPPVVEARDYRSQEITNTVIKVLSTENPAETSKKLKPLEKIHQFLSSQSK